MSVYVSLGTRTEGDVWMDGMHGRRFFPAVRCRVVYLLTCLPVCLTAYPVGSDFLGFGFGSLVTGQRSLDGCLWGISLGNEWMDGWRDECMDR